MATTISKEAKKIQKKLNDAQAQAEAARHNYQTKLDEAKATMQDASNQLEFAEDPATYTELLEQIRLAKGAMQFYRNKLDKAADEPLFTSEEYNDMRARMLTRKYLTMQCYWQTKCMSYGGYSMMPKMFAMNTLALLTVYRTIKAQLTIPRQMQVLELTTTCKAA